jgi:prolyl-tRNA synthetase
MEYVWATSWGVSTRLIGALVMAHSDDEGLVMPPRIAPLQVVIVPIYNKDAEARQKIDDKAAQLVKELRAKGIRVKFDDDDSNRPGWKFAEYELKGVPVRIALGARDLENNQVEVARRDTKEKAPVSLDGITDHVAQLLEEIQSNLFNRALAFREANTRSIDTWDEFVKALDETPGFISAHWDGTPETEEKIKELTKATIRCIPLNNKQETGKCILTGNPSTQRVLFARAY